jgi:hypothetical protein
LRTKPNLSLIRVALIVALCESRNSYKPSSERLKTFDFIVIDMVGREGFEPT